MPEAFQYIIDIVFPLLENISNWVGSLSDLVAALGWFAAILFSTLFWRSERLRHRYTKVFFPRDFREFYRYFAKQVGKSKDEIYHTGDGFNMRNQQSRSNSDILDAAFVKALEKGVKVFRFQITETMTINWLRRLKAFKEAYPNNFFIYYNPNHENVGSICVIDAGTRKTLVEQQITTGKQLGRGTEPQDFAFVHGHQHRSDNTKELVNQIIMDKGTMQLDLDNIGELEKVLFDKRLRRYIDNNNSVLIDPELVELTGKFPAHELEYDPDYFDEYPLPKN